MSSLSIYITVNISYSIATNI